MEMQSASFLSLAAFVVLVLALSLLFVAAIRRVARAEGWSAAQEIRHTGAAAGGVLFVLIFSAQLAETGLQASLANTPYFFIYPICTFALAIALALSSVGRDFAKHLPIAGLVGFQAFRLPLELILHRWYDEGVIPVQMTFSGDNFDIVTGVSALLLGILLYFKRAGRSAIWIFNLVGSALLVAVVHIAILSSPVPIRTYFNEPTLLVALHAPYTWILPICVGGALFGHIVVFRYLLQNRNA